MASINRMVKKSCLTPGHRGLCMEWSRKCMAVVLKTEGIMHKDQWRKWRWGRGGTLHLPEIGNLLKIFGSVGDLKAIEYTETNIEKLRERGQNPVYMWLSLSWLFVRMQARTALLDFSSMVDRPLNIGKWYNIDLWNFAENKANLELSRKSQIFAKSFHLILEILFNIRKERTSFFSQNRPEGNNKICQKLRGQRLSACAATEILTATTKRNTTIFTTIVCLDAKTNPLSSCWAFVNPFQVAVFDEFNNLWKIPT